MMTRANKPFKTHSNICLPLMARNEADLLVEVDKLVNAKPDIIEWRVDYFDDFETIDLMTDLVNKITPKLNNIPLLVTLRTKREGGKADISDSLYVQLIEQYATHLIIDFLDIQFHSVKNHEGLLTLLKHQQIILVISYHDFTKTLSKEEMMKLLKEMQHYYPSSVYKLAQMPRDFEDVLNVMSVSYEVGKEETVIMIAMGELGKVTRVLTKQLNSWLTFVSLDALSAPGQMTIEQAKELLSQFK
ncbi:type I 3-dehydroquinate dehydratase [Vagococcus xieshaowenii]|uniref:3-dehydroquinate dehydratase n=1 Tax=Vagococcus xieshaowenii TaxID=2562451 RepID=A0AAJ5JM54_9ENTE|nr:type I 3-dehydroquinate dehydratase [Vagococcus xieshaowenii]QCA28631.1 type I 3-dehydroquinate dehydratase [Vagococcus xieshaowenii]TFZ40561.1 type I 3-dehydroquinate dehydratase [Vagococcus xieshaowenii]